jgi:hypothetical protein
MTQTYSMRKYLVLITLVWLAYAILTFLTPSAEAITRFGLTYTQFEIIRVTFLVPSLLIWLSAGYALIRFCNYSKLVHDSPESKGFSQIAEGVLLLLLALIIPTFVSLLSAFNPDTLGVEKLVTIFRNYITIILYLTSFWQLRQGSKNLNLTINPRGLNANLRQYVVWFVILLGIAYAAAIFQNEFRTHSNDPLIRSTYFLPDWLIITTIVIPYVFIWLWGLLAIVNFREYSKSVQGTVYRKAFSNTSNGLIAIIGLSIGVQFLSQLAGFLGRSNLSIILGIIYLLLLIMTVGYFSIARGMRELAAIEEI